MNNTWQTTGIWEHFTVRDGLPDMKIECIFEDSRGALWLGTHDRGVVCYDGGEFRSFSCRDGLAGEGVFSITEDREGNLWLGTSQGLTVYDRQTFNPLPLEEHGSFLWGSCMDQEGRLWFGMERQPGRPPMVCRWNGVALERLELAETADAQGQSIHQVVCDSQGVLWFGGDGLYRCEDGANFECVVKSNDKVSQIQSLLAHTNKSLWIASNNGLWRYTENHFDRLLTEENIYGPVSLLQDPSGVLWLTTYDGRLMYYDGETFTPVRRLNTTLRSGLCRDRAGRLWIGTYGIGLYCYDVNRIRIFQTEQGLPVNSVLCLAEEKATGTLWLGTRKGLVGWDGNMVFSSDKSNIIKDLEVTKILEDTSQTLWIATRIGYLFVFMENQIKSLPLSPMERYKINSLTEDREGRIWFGFRYGKGFGYCQGEEVRYFLPQKETDYPTWIGAIETDRQGHVWLGSASPAQWDGLCCYDGISFKHIEGISKTSILALHEDRAGHLWVGTSDGIKYYDGERYIAFTKEEVLPCEIITAIAEAEDGTLWFGTEGGGVYRYDGKVFQIIQIPGDPMRNVIHDIYQDSRKRVWLATEGGLIQYIPHQLKPEVVIDAVTADQKYPMPSEIQLPTTAVRISFHFHGKSPVDPASSLVYRYCLHGYDQDWHQTRNTIVEYPQLESGEYTFLLQTVDRDLNYSETARVKLIVTADPRIEAFNEALRDGTVQGEFIGHSAALSKVKAQIQHVAPTDITVLVLGETGTGKGLVTRAVHELSKRREGPFIFVNCGTLQGALVDSELFGHERGAFTGAVSRKIGKFELADGGSIFLDEIGDLPLESQIRLLHVLQDRFIERVGGTHTISVNVRVLAATNRDLRKAVREGAFRTDLYYRLNDFTIRLPPLRERKEDIEDLAEYFTHRFATHLNLRPPRISEEAMKALRAYDWPGNIRELEHTLQRAVILAREGPIKPTHIVVEPAIDENFDPEAFAVLPLEEYERRYLTKILEYTGGVIYGEQGAAALLGLHPNTLRSRMQKLGVKKPKG